MKEREGKREENGKKIILVHALIRNCVISQLFISIIVISFLQYMVKVVSGTAIMTLNKR